MSQTPLWALEGGASNSPPNGGPFGVGIAPALLRRCPRCWCDHSTTTASHCGQCGLLIPREVQHKPLWPSAPPRHGAPSSHQRQPEQAARGTSRPAAARVPAGPAGSHRVSMTAPSSSEDEDEDGDGDGSGGRHGARRPAAAAATAGRAAPPPGPATAARPPRRGSQASRGTFSMRPAKKVTSNLFEEPRVVAQPSLAPANSADNPIVIPDSPLRPLSKGNVNGHGHGKGKAPAVVVVVESSASEDEAGAGAGAGRDGPQTAKRKRQGTHTHAQQRRQTWAAAAAGGGASAGESLSDSWLSSVTKLVAGGAAGAGEGAASRHPAARAGPTYAEVCAAAAQGGKGRGKAGDALAKKPGHHTHAHAAHNNRAGLLPVPANPTATNPADLASRGKRSRDRRDTDGGRDSNKHQDGEQVRKRRREDGHGSAHGVERPSASASASASRVPGGRGGGGITQVLYLDLDNWRNFFQKLPRGMLLPQSTHVHGVYGGSTAFTPPVGCPAFDDLLASNRWSLQHAGKTKDAADFALVLQMGRDMHTKPKNVAFTVLSGDGGFDELKRHCEESGRQFQRVNPHDLRQDNALLLGFLASIAEQ